MNDDGLMEVHLINTDSISKIAIYLSGVKDGKGNLLPLGTIDLDELWNTVKYLQGDVRFKAEKDRKEATE